MHVLEGSVKQYTQITLHVQNCPECRRIMVETERALAQLQQPSHVDPGDDFTEKVLRQARRGLFDRLWNPGWMPFGRALSWSAASVVLLILLAVWGLQPEIGSDHVTAALPPEVIAGAPCALPVTVTDPQGEPICNGRVEVSGEGICTFTGKTDDSGFCQASLVLPPVADAKSLMLNVKVTTGSGEHRLYMPVQVKMAETLYLSTDKPLYQPGQTVHLRLMCLQSIALTPVAKRAITLTICDKRGNLLQKQELTSDEWGIAAFDFPLDSEAAPGDYTIEAKSASDTATRSVTVSRYVLPKFKAVISTDRGWYQPGETIGGTVEARYFFGKPCAGAHVRIQALPRNGMEEQPAGGRRWRGRCGRALPLPAHAAGQTLRHRATRGQCGGRARCRGD